MRWLSGWESPCHIPPSSASPQERTQNHATSDQPLNIIETNELMQLCCMLLKLVPVLMPKDSINHKGYAFLKASALPASLFIVKRRS